VKGDLAAGVRLVVGGGGGAVKRDKAEITGATNGRKSVKASQMILLQNSSLGGSICIYQLKEEGDATLRFNGVKNTEKGKRA